MFAGLALFLITSVSFASPWSAAMEVLGLGSSSTFSVLQDKKGSDVATPKVEVMDATEKSDEEVALTKDPGGFSADYKPQMNQMPENMMVPLTGTLNIPGDYPTLAAAVTDLNTQGVGAGGVTFNLIAGNPQTAPAGGYIIGGTGSLVLTSSSAANPITFTGNGNTITAGVQTVGALNDGIFKLIGADYVTLQGFTMQENAANVVNTPAASNTMTEWAIALLYVTLTDGSQNNTIQNNTISLNRTYLNTSAIYSNTRHSATAVTTSAEVTAASGSNSNNKVYGNGISNTNYGIVFIGAGTTIAAIDSGNDIGGAGAGTGNTITNWGGGAALTSYVSLTGSNYCVFMNQQINDNFSFNTITSAALTQAVTTGGFLKNYSVANPVGTITTTINNNTVQITNNPTTATAGTVIGLNSQGITTLLSTATMSMNNNTVQNSVVGGSTATTVGLTAITNLSAPGTINMNGNTVLNNAITAPTSTTGIIAGITSSGAAGTLNMNNNVLRSLASTASTTGQIQGIVNTGAVVTAVNMNGNQLGNALSGFFSTSTASTGTGLFGFVNAGGAATAALSIQNNDIRGITYNVSAVASQNYIQNTAATLSQNISGNTFTNLTVNSTGSATFISNGVNAPATGSKTINGNSIVTGFNKTGAGGTVTLYADGGSSTSTTPVQNNNNNFSNITVTGATTIAGWFNNDGTGSTPAKTMTGNTFNNWLGGTSPIIALQSNFGGSNTMSGNVVTNISGQGAITGMLVGSSGTVATLNVTGNAVGGLSSTGTGGAVTGISSTIPATTTNISTNIVNTLSTTGAAAATGILNSAGTTANLFRNKIYDVSGSNATSTVNGVLLSGGTTVNTYNNLIGDLRTPAASAANPLIGINITSTTASSTQNVSFNTVYLNATSSGGTFGSSALFHTSSATATTAALNLRNNILVNNSTPGGTGISAAYRRSSATLTNYAPASNNNDFFGGALYADGTNTITTIGAYKTFVAPRDSASFSENPTFLSTSGASGNFLHIDPAVATQIESGASPIGGITDDFDAQVRNGSTPDVGADEFNGIGIDLSAPVITYTPLANTGLTTNRVLSTTITDATGVASGANLPRIYFKKSTDASYVSTQCVMTGGTAQNGTYDCTINNALVGGGSVAVADVIQYFVVAQDTAGTPNVGSNPAGASGADVNSITFGGTPNQYTILPSISGGKTVGTGGDYATLTAAAAAINAAEITAPVTLTLTDPTYGGETFPIVFNANSGSSSTNTVTIKPAASVSPVITGVSASCIINFNGADWMTLDGSNVVGGTTRNLTVENTGTSTSSAVVCITSTGVGTGATNNTVKNTNVIGSTVTATARTLAGIFSGSSTISNTSAGADNDNNTIQNNSITKTTYGIYSGGASALNKNTGTVITENVMNAASPNNITTGGIFVNFDNATVISQNDISVLKHDGTTGTTNTAFGIALGVVPNNTVTVFAGSDVTGAQVTRNRINGVTQMNATGYAAFGIVVNSVTSGTTLLANNMVSGVISPATANDFTAGIVAGGGTGSTTNVYHNSVSMTGTRTGSGFPSYALAINSGNPIVNVRNNIFSNTQTGGTGKAYAIANASSTFTNMSSSFNDLYVSGASTFVGQTGGLGTAGTDRADLAAWNTATGSDTAPDSISMDPVFVNPASDLHLQTSPLSSPALGAGTGLLAVTVDYDNDPRPTANPDMGADEVVQVAGGSFPSGTFYNAILTPGTYTGNVTVTNSLTISGTVDVGANTVIIGCDTAVNGAGGFNYIVGNVQKQFCATGTFSFPVGTVPNGSRPNGDDEKSMEGQTLVPEGSFPEFTPVDVNITAGTFPSSLTVSVTDAFLPQLVQANAISRYWTVTETGNVTADMTFHYLDAPLDVNGNESLYKAFRRSGGFTTEYVPSSNNPAGNTFTATGVTNFSDWGAGAAAATASNASISGRVTTASGQGIRNATVMITGGSLTEPIIVRTGNFGYYNFDNLRVGETYVVQVGAKRFRFPEPTRVITLQEAVGDLDFTANPNE